MVAPVCTSKFMSSASKSELRELQELHVTAVKPSGSRCRGEHPGDGGDASDASDASDATESACNVEQGGGTRALNL